MDIASSNNAAEVVNSVLCLHLTLCFSKEEISPLQRANGAGSNSLGGHHTERLVNSEVATFAVHVLDEITVQ